MNTTVTNRKPIRLGVLVILSIFLSWEAAAQVDIESKSLSQVIDWLEITLKYDYFKTNENNWWHNSIEFYEPDSLIIYKNVYNPGKKSGNKSYYIRNIPLASLNPHNIDIRRTYNNKGRYTDGVEMVFTTTHNEKVITKSVNSRSGSSESSFRIILPQFLLDSTHAMPEKIKAHFQRAIHLVHVNDFTGFEGLERVGIVLKSLEGKFNWERHNPNYFEKPERGEREYRRFIDQFRLEVSDSHPEHPERDNRILLGYDTLKRKFYHIQFTRIELSPQIDDYEILEGKSLRLVSHRGDERLVMEIVNRNEHRTYSEQKGADNAWVPNASIPLIVFRRN